MSTKFDHYSQDGWKNLCSQMKIDTTSDWSKWNLNQKYASLFYWVKISIGTGNGGKNVFLVQWQCCHSKSSRHMNEYCEILKTYPQEIPLNEMKSTLLTLSQSTLNNIDHRVNYIKIIANKASDSNPAGFTSPKSPTYVIPSEKPLFSDKKRDFQPIVYNTDRQVDSEFIRSTKRVGNLDPIELKPATFNYNPTSSTPLFTLTANATTRAKPRAITAAPKKKSTFDTFGSDILSCFVGNTENTAKYEKETDSDEDYDDQNNVKKILENSRNVSIDNDGVTEEIWNRYTKEKFKLQKYQKYKNHVPLYENAFNDANIRGNCIHPTTAKGYCTKKSSFRNLCTLHKNMIENVLNGKES